MFSVTIAAMRAMEMKSASAIPGSSPMPLRSMTDCWRSMNSLMTVPFLCSPRSSPEGPRAGSGVIRRSDPWKAADLGRAVTVVMPRLRA